MLKVEARETSLLPWGLDFRSPSIVRPVLVDFLDAVRESFGDGGEPEFLHEFEENVTQATGFLAIPSESWRRRRWRRRRTLLYVLPKGRSMWLVVRTQHRMLCAALAMCFSSWTMEPCVQRELVTYPCVPMLEPSPAHSMAGGGVGARVRAFSTHANTSARAPPCCLRSSPRPLSLRRYDGHTASVCSRSSAAIRLVLFVLLPPRDARRLRGRSAPMAFVVAIGSSDGPAIKDAATHTHI